MIDTPNMAVVLDAPNNPPDETRFETSFTSSLADDENVTTEIIDSVDDGGNDHAGGTDSDEFIKKDEGGDNSIKKDAPSSPRSTLPFSLPTNATVPSDLDSSSFSSYQSSCLSSPASSLENGGNVKYSPASSSSSPSVLSVEKMFEECNGDGDDDAVTPPSPTRHDAPCLPQMGSDTIGGGNNASSSLGQKLDFLERRWANVKVSSPVGSAAAEAADNSHAFFPDGDDEEGDNFEHDGMPLEAMKRNEMLDSEYYSNSSGGFLEDEAAYLRDNSGEFSSDVASSSSDESSGLWAETNEGGVRFFDNGRYIYGTDDDGTDDSDSLGLVFTNTSEDEYEVVLDDNEIAEEQEEEEDWQRDRRQCGLLMPTILEEGESSCSENDSIDDCDAAHEQQHQKENDENGQSKEATSRSPAGEETAESNDSSLSFPISDEEENEKVGLKLKLQLPLMPTLDEGPVDEGEINKEALEEKLSSVSLDPKMTTTEQQQQPDTSLQKNRQETQKQQAPLPSPPQSTIDISKQARSSSPPKSTLSHNKLRISPPSSPPSSQCPMSPPPPNYRYTQSYKKKKRKKHIISKPFRSFGKLVKKSLHGGNNKKD